MSRASSTVPPLGRGLYEFIEDQTLWATRCRSAARASVSLCVVGIALAMYGQTDRVNQLVRQLKAGNGLSADSRTTLIRIGAPAVDPLIEALNDNHAAVRKEAVLILGKIKDPRAVAPLIGALKDKDYDVEHRAADALANIGDPAVGPLIAGFKDADIGAGFGAASINSAAPLILGRIGAPAVEPLIDALKGPNSTVRKYAAVALGFTKDARAVEPLIDALGDKVADVWMAATAALGQIGAPAVASLITALHKKTSYAYAATDYEESEALGRIGAPAVDSLINAMKDTDSVVRKDAAHALGITADHRAVITLIAALKDENSRVRENAAEALGNIKDPRSAEALIDALKDKTSGIQLLSAKALVEVKDPRETEALVGLLQNPDLMVRNYAGMALAPIRDPRAISALLKSLNEGNTEVIAGAYKFFIARGDVDSEDALIRVLPAWGDQQMAQDFLNSGNAKLGSAATAWAASHGFRITRMF